VFRHVCSAVMKADKQQQLAEAANVLSYNNERGGIVRDDMLVLSSFPTNPTMSLSAPSSAPSFSGFNPSSSPPHMFPMATVVAGSSADGACIV
jgi:hypothetical protein